jgi:hypothetical protein
MGLAEKPPLRTLHQHKEELSIRELKNTISGIVVNISGISNSPFSKAILDNGFSVMLMPGTDQIKKWDKLKIIPDTRIIHLNDSKEVWIIRNKKSVGKIYISECQVIMNKQWDGASRQLIENSKKSESLKHKDWWKKYYESQKQKKKFNPNWLEDLKKAASLGTINGELD